MKKAVFDGETLYYPFSFIDEDRSIFDHIESDMEVSLALRDKNGEKVTISFRVTRNAFLGSYCRRIHGEVLGVGDGLYREIQIKLNSRYPEDDTVEVFLQAPPIEI